MPFVGSRRPDGFPNMSPGRWRSVFAAVGLLVLTVAAIVYVAPAFGHRLGRSETLNGARLNPPSFLARPHMSYSSVLLHCEFCRHVSPSQVKNRVVELGWLVSDEALRGLVSTNAPNRPPTGADAPLPRLVWVVQWQSSCWSQMPNGVTSCTTYDLIDDATRWELDTGQAWRS
jgi:hypothetical protein